MNRQQAQNNVDTNVVNERTSRGGTRIIRHVWFAPPERSRFTGEFLFVQGSEESCAQGHEYVDRLFAFLARYDITMVRVYTTEEDMISYGPV